MGKKCEVSERGAQVTEERGRGCWTISRNPYPFIKLPILLNRLQVRQVRRVGRKVHRLNRHSWHSLSTKTPSLQSLASLDP